MGDGHTTVAAFIRRLSTELYARAVTDEVTRGIILRALLHGAVSADFLRHIDATPELEERVRSGSATFDDYAHALYACIPAGAESELIHHACSFRRRPNECLSAMCHRFDSTIRDLAALGLSLPEDAQFWILYRSLSSEEQGFLGNTNGVALNLRRQWKESPSACAARHAALFAALRDFCLKSPYASRSSTRAPPPDTPARGVPEIGRAHV